ncbi:hypothetical protein HN587_02880 [Candidatus Woesearchaeota archaeon]|jgi:hypothetical protein|nr:hypothetical protein [Candidatus Woesearchaeota archaeon]
MVEHEDTASKELSDILSEIQRTHKTHSPNEVVLFAHQDTSYTLQDLTAEISSLGYDGAGEKQYEAYSHGIKSGNSQIGTLQINARKGSIEITYSPQTTTQESTNDNELSFKMKVGFGSRVIDYEVKGNDGMYRSHFQKRMVKGLMTDLLKQTQKT